MNNQYNTYQHIPSTNPSAPPENNFYVGYKYKLIIGLMFTISIISIIISIIAISKSGKIGPPGPQGKQGNQGIQGVPGINPSYIGFHASTSNQMVLVSGQVYQIIFETVEYDTNNTYNPLTGYAIISANGYYHVISSVEIYSSSVPSTTWWFSASISILVNQVTISSATYHYAQPGGSGNVDISMIIPDYLYLNQGDILCVKVVQTNNCCNFIADGYSFLTLSKIG